MTKGKMIAALLGATVLSFGSAVTSTLAWFSVTRANSVTTADIETWNPGGGLSIAGVEVPDGGMSLVGNTVEGSPIFTAASDIDDVSGNGAHLYDSVLNPEGTEILGYDEVSYKNKFDNQQFFEFGLVFSNSAEGSQPPLAIYLDEPTTFAPVDPSLPRDILATQALRIAILDKTRTTVLCYYQQGREIVHSGQPYKYCYSDGTNTLKDATTINHAVLDRALVPTTSDLPELLESQCIIANLPSGGTELVYVRGWFEGTSMFCTNDAIQGLVKFTLAFGGVAL
ncbi:MAG: hypothetical protein HUJ60_03965 [Bacilli bacterium]|nr:hypothetical protein [Bacilli bacterium]